MAIVLMGSHPVYTDNKLKEKLKGEINNYDFPAKNKILDMIDQEIIIPVIGVKPDFIQKIADFIWSPTNLNKNIGFYYKGKIYIIYIHKNIDPFKVTIHECIHYVEEKNKSKFYSINLNLLSDFYETFFKKYLVLKKINKDIIKQFIIELAKRTSGLVLTPIEYWRFNKIYNIVGVSSYIYSSLEREEYNNRISDLNSFRHKYWTGNRSEAYKYILIKGPLFDAYDKISSKIKFVSGQEIYAPSEILCKLAEFDYKHPNITKTLELL